MSQKYTVSFENPPFFPTNLEELAQDASFATRVGLISQLSRIRIDVRMRIVNKQRYMFKWLVLLAKNLLDDEFTQIRIFVDTSNDIELCNHLWEEILLNDPTYNSYSKSKLLQFKNRISISLTSDLHLKITDKLFIVFNPDNIYQDRSNLLDEVQAICFHSALRNIPIIFVNPNLMATGEHVLLYIYIDI
jgi:hypothetical protein